MTLVVCETTAAITTHLRRLTVEWPKSLTGHRSPRPLTLCGSTAAWDTNIPIGKARCRDCLAEYESEVA